MKPQQFKAVKINAGRYRIGKLIVVRSGFGWHRADEQGGGRIASSLVECVECANDPATYEHNLALGNDA